MSATTSRSVRDVFFFNGTAPRPGQPPPLININLNEDKLIVEGAIRVDVDWIETSKRALRKFDVNLTTVVLVRSEAANKVVSQTLSADRGRSESYKASSARSPQAAARPSQRAFRPRVVVYHLLLKKNDEDKSPFTLTKVPSCEGGVLRDRLRGKPPYEINHRFNDCKRDCTNLTDDLRERHPSMAKIDDNVNAVRLIIETDKRMADQQI
ncbi:hypothetical protein EVAR_93246_1 [Eumeta japonica]|uniref:Uncharacterized protein n=1 Tax=Eumeta variegata TaxID=151549 RepID=A0A4C1TY23_EUMVA|nr:hypothetical protein EVAR_93246_1 [Eumeta japonica]